MKDAQAAKAQAATDADASRPVPATKAGEPDFALIELLFFGYRDFVGEADRLLEPHGFGRAHHRVLHFVNRHRGLTIAELLDILEITKQSLARVLKDLMEAGFVEQRPGEEDRRQRQLFPTDKGAELGNALATLQSQRVARALLAAGPDNRGAVERFLAGLMDEGPRRRLPFDVPAR